MALLNVLGSIFDTTTGTHTVTATPAVGDVIIIVTNDSGYTGVVTPTDNNSSGAYTLINSALFTSSADILAAYIRTTVIPAASSTIFSHAAASSTGGGMVVYSINAGQSKSPIAAILQSAVQANQAASGTPAPVLAAIPKPFNAVITAVGNATSPGGVTIRSSPAYTRDIDLGHTVPAAGFDCGHINAGETSATVTWGSTSASAFASLAMEIDMLPTNDFNNYEFASAKTSNAGILSVTEKIK